MMAATQELPKAFAVLFKDLNLWGVNSFFKIGWQWPKEFIKPLCTALCRKQVEIDRKDISFDQLQLITLHFDGSIEPRNLQNINGFKGKLFAASSGDVIYSKIDVRNGAIGIISDEMLLAAVSSEFPVYAVLPDVALPEYIKLVFRTKQFLKLINSMISGASGRKRVQPKQLEQIEIPLPPIAVQRVIVDRWQTAQAEIKAANKRIDHLEHEIPKLILQELRIPYHEAVNLPKVFVLLWEELERWSVSYLSRMITGVNDIQKSKYEIKALGDISKVSYGVQKCPSNRPGKSAKPYLRVANVQRGQLDLSKIKYIEVPDAEMENLRLQKGDLLVCEGNSVDLVGRPAIWNDEILDCIHQNHILKVRLNEQIALPEFVLEYMQTFPARGYFRARAKFTTNLASINSNDLREFPIPLPSLEMQKEIVQQVEVARQAINREREAVDRQKRAIEAEIEALILGGQVIEVVAAV